MLGDGPGGRDRRLPSENDGGMYDHTSLILIVHAPDFSGKCLLSPFYLFSKACKEIIQLAKMLKVLRGEPGACAGMFLTF